jgi:ATP-binding cassette, subfamily C, bacterial CydC
MNDRPLRRLVVLARPLRPRFALATALGALAVGSAVALMGTSGYLISKASLRPPILSLSIVIVSVRLFGVSRGVFRYLERLSSHDAALRLLGRLRVQFYERLEPLVPAGLPRARSGDLLSRFVADVDALQNLYLRGIAPPLVAVVVGAGSVAAAGLLLPEAAPWLALGLLLGAIVLPAVTLALARAAGRRQAGARATLANEVVELVSAAPELVAYERTGAQLERVASADAALTRIAARDALAAGIGEGASTLLAGATAVAVLVVGVRGTDTGALRGVLLAALVLLATAAFEAVRPLPEAAQQLAATSGAATRLFELTDREPPVRDPADPLAPPRGEVLRVEDVRVRYAEGEPWVLDGAALELRASERIVLLGPSGAGKTTLASLLVRFRDPDEGRVTLDGHDLRAYAQDDIRRVVALAGQDAHLFQTTIRNNVRLAKPDAGDDEIEAALRRARAWEWVASLPDGIDTDVGEQGAFVSGGQRQRIALARAFLSGARMIVLDEPTAHLDTETATAIVDDLLAAAGGTGVLLITHAPLRLEQFDEVVHLDRGRIQSNLRPAGDRPCSA